MERKRIGLALCGLDCHWFLIVISKRPTDRWSLKSTACLSRSRSEFNGRRRTEQDGATRGSWRTCDILIGRRIAMCNSNCWSLVVGGVGGGGERVKRSVHLTNQSLQISFVCNYYLVHKLQFEWCFREHYITDINIVVLRPGPGKLMKMCPRNERRRGNTEIQQRVKLIELNRILFVVRRNRYLQI